jgi:DNA repair exonuclease SbcCD ATPase subunit
MDKIPLQTLKPTEHKTSEELIGELQCQCASVRRNFKPTVRSRREFVRDESVEFDSVFEKELLKIDSDVEKVYLTETLPKIEEELNLWLKEYKNLLDELSKLHDDNAKDQVRIKNLNNEFKIIQNLIFQKLTLKQSDERIQEKLKRISIVENIKKSLLHEVQNLCLHLERTKLEGEDKLKRTTNNFKEVIRYLNRGFEAERITHAETNEVLRKLEHTLRETINQCQNAEANTQVLHDELKKTRTELHRCQKDLTEHVNLYFVIDD